MITPSLTPSALPALQKARDALKVAWVHLTNGTSDDADRDLIHYAILAANSALASLTPSDVAPQAETAKSDKANFAQASGACDLQTALPAFTPGPLDDALLATLELIASGLEADGRTMDGMTKAAAAAKARAAIAMYDAAASISKETP